MCVCRVCVLFVYVPVAFFNACHFPVDDVVESKVMMIDVPTVCSMEYVFFESGRFLPKQPRKDLKIKQVISSPFFPRNRMFTFRIPDLQLLPIVCFGCWGGGLIFGTTKNGFGNFRLSQALRLMDVLVSSLVRNELLGEAIIVGFSESDSKQKGDTPGKINIEPENTPLWKGKSSSTPLHF